MCEYHSNRIKKHIKLGRKNHYLFFITLFFIIIQKKYKQKFTMGLLSTFVHEINSWDDDSFLK
jgi:hypothetical protein